MNEEAEDPLFEGSDAQDIDQDLLSSSPPQNLPSRSAGKKKQGQLPNSKRSNTRSAYGGSNS